MCTSMQGRLFIVLLGKDHFIKECVYVSTTEKHAHTRTVSTVTLPTWVHTHIHTHTHLSQQKQELVDTANEPKCYFSIKLWMCTKPRNSSQACSSSMTDESFSSLKLLFFLSNTDSASLLSCSIMPQASAAVKSHCLSCFFFPPHPI